MAYTPYHADWKDFPDATTPITAVALDYIESGIASSSQVFVSADNTVLTSGVQTIASATPSASGRFSAHFSLRVDSGNPQVLFWVDWTDAGGSHSDFLFSRNFSADTYTFDPVFVYATTDGPIRVKAQTTVPSVAYVSASVVSL